MTNEIHLCDSTICTFEWPCPLDSVLRQWECRCMGWRCRGGPASSRSGAHATLKSRNPAQWMGDLNDRCSPRDENSSHQLRETEIARKQTKNISPVSIRQIMTIPPVWEREGPRQCSVHNPRPGCLCSAMWPTLGGNVVSNI